MIDLDLVFLGGLFPQELKEEISTNSIGAVQNAADALQWNYVKGFNQLGINNFKIINSLFIGSYPKRYKKLVINSSFFENNHCKNNLNVGFNNLSGYKIFSRKNSLKKPLKEWAQNGAQNKAIIAYALTTVMVDSLIYVKKLNPNIKTCLIVPDLPEYMNLSTEKTGLYTRLKSWDMKKLYEKVSEIDSFVLLTKQMNDKLKIQNFVVVEGVASDNISPQKNSDIIPKSVLYAGTLNERYGVKSLVEAFAKTTDPEMRLILCGVGDSENFIKEMAQKDKRILFKGALSRDDVLKLIGKSSLIANPRKNDEEFTKYSFPSKNIEALSSGRPLLAYKLDGIPDEYDDYIYYVKDNDVLSLSKKLQEICNKPPQELHEFGENAKKFVLENKSTALQAKKVLDMLKNQ